MKIVTTFFFFLTLNLCSGKYRLNDHHKAELIELEQEIMAIDMFSDINLDYSERSVEDISVVLGEKLLQDSMTLLQIEEVVRVPLLVYLGNVHIKNKGGEWLSYSKTSFAPAGIARDGKLSTMFLSIYHDVLLEYPAVESYRRSPEGIFGFDLVLAYIEADLK